MPQRDLSYLMDILEAGKQVRAFIAGVDKETFNGNSLVQSAVIRQIEIIGEATKRVSEEFKAAHPEIPWRQLSGMRDILIHAYDHVDIDEVWNAAEFDMPILIKQIESLVQTFRA